MPLDPWSTLCNNCQDEQIPGSRCPRWCTGQAREEERATEAVRRTEGLTHHYETSPHDPGALLCEARRREHPAANRKIANIARKLREEQEEAEADCTTPRTGHISLKFGDLSMSKGSDQLNAINNQL